MQAGCRRCLRLRGQNAGGCRAIPIEVRQGIVAAAQIGQRPPDEECGGRCAKLRVGGCLQRRQGLGRPAGTEQGLPKAQIGVGGNGGIGTLRHGAEDVGGGVEVAIALQGRARCRRWF